jgi:hypothetical protein
MNSTAKAALEKGFADARDQLLASRPDRRAVQLFNSNITHFGPWLGIEPEKYVVKLDIQLPCPPIARHADTWPPIPRGASCGCGGHGKRLP